MKKKQRTIKEEFYCSYKPKDLFVPTCFFFCFFKANMIAGGLFYH